MISLDVKDLTGAFILEGWEDMLLGCNRDGAIDELPLAWNLTGCCWCIEVGDAKLEGPRLPKLELFKVDALGPYNIIL